MPKIPWRQILKMGLGMSKLFLPTTISDAVDAIEDHVDAMVKGGAAGWSSEAKQTAALETLLKSVAVAEHWQARDLLDDAQVLAAGRQAINAVHAQKVAIAQLTDTLRAFKAARKPQP